MKALKDEKLNGYSGNPTYKVFNVVLDEDVNIDKLLVNLEISDNQITLKRTLHGGHWNTMCLPFYLSSDNITEVFGSDAKVVTFEGCKDNVMNFKQVWSVEKCTPFMVWLSEDKSSITFEYNGWVNGFIYMSMRTIERSEDHMTCEFKIKDNGIGMSEEFIKNELFTPFVQADNSPRSDYNGTGLGMPIVKQLVEKMGGTITVESKLGEGSCFTVILPFKIDTNARLEEKEDFNADISGVRILLVEDNELNVEIAEFMLTENGAKVETVKNGLEAVQHFEACESGTYDVILMDVMMPVMDGLTATKTIRSLERQDAKTIPIIAMTANAFREDAEKCMEAGMNAHLAKPLDDKTIKQTICEELRSSRDR